MASQAAIYDLTLYDTDGNPIWGSSSSGVITESSFQTPDSSKSHDRDWLLLPTNSDGPKVDFVQGKSRIGAITASVIDFRSTSTDQTTGTLTANIDDTIGGRAVLRRWDATNSTWIVLMDGVVESYSVDSERVVVYDFHLRDAREFEREGELFSSNFVLWGENGESGPGTGYITNRVATAFQIFGDFDEHFVPEVGPYQSRSIGTVDHFRRASDADPDNGIHYGVAMAYVPDRDLALQLPDVGEPTQADDGLFYFRDFRIEWRAKGSSDDYTVLRNMPRAVGKNAVEDRSGMLEDHQNDKDAVLSGPPHAMLYFGSTESSDIPTDGQEIEYRVFAERITEETPFFWDGGTLGDLLTEISNGDHTDSVPEENYDATALSDFAGASIQARFILTEPVKDRRRWVQENIYQAAFRAPAFDTSGNLYFPEWRRPPNSETVPVLDATGDDSSLEPVGEWEHGITNAIRKVEYTYLRETIQSNEDAKERLDLEDTLGDETLDIWRRLVATEVTTTSEASDPVPGAKTLEYAPVTIRTFAGADDAPDDGSTLEDIGDGQAQDAINRIFQRFSRGAPTYKATVHATDTNLNYQVGDWVIVRAEWLPRYTSGKRELSELMQIFGISDPNPAQREFFLVSGNVTDHSDDDTVTGTDCFSGGSTQPAPDGRTARYFSSDGNLTNTCGTAQEVDVLLIAGGGSGQEQRNGGGAGQALEVTSVTINPGETIPITIGQGGSGDGVDGGNTVLWVDDNGDALDPDNDQAPSEREAKGGGVGHVGSGHTPQEDADHAPGSSTTQVGSCCDGLTAGGGGASNTGNGSSGSKTADCTGAQDICESFGGDAAAATSYPTYAVTVGAGGDGWGTETTASSGAFPGGGGGSNVTGADGKDGAVVVLYSGAEQTLDSPTITSTTETGEEQRQICVTGDDFPVVRPEGFRLRIEYAWGDSEPAADSGDWKLAGFLTEPGCVTTDPIPVGETVYSRAIAESDNEQPSDPGDTDTSTQSESAGLTRFKVELDANDQPDLSWSENPFTKSIRIRGIRHDQEDDTSRDLTQIADVVASDRAYDVLQTVEEGRFFTADLETWDDVDHGYERHVSTDSPSSHLRLGEGSGTTANDATANNNDGTYLGSPTLGATGLLTEDDNTAVTFDGNDDAVTVSGIGSVGSDVTKTVEFWVSTTESGSNLFLCGVVNSGDNTKWMLATNKDVDGSNTAGRTTLQTSGGANGNAYNIAIDDNIYDGNAHHIAIVQNAKDDIDIYVDGSLATIVNTLDQGPAAPTAWDQDFAFGARNNGGTLDKFVAATIDEIAVYPTALSATRIQAHYDAGTGETTDETQVAGTIGKIHRVAVLNPTIDAATSDEVDAALDNLVFDADLGLALDYELNPVRDST